MKRPPRAVFTAPAWLLEATKATEQTTDREFYHFTCTHALIAARDEPTNVQASCIAGDGARNDGDVEHLSNQQSFQHLRF
jgi:hypothetical protein